MKNYKHEDIKIPPENIIINHLQQKGAEWSEDQEAYKTTEQGWLIKWQPWHIQIHYRPQQTNLNYANSFKIVLNTELTLKRTDNIHNKIVVEYFLEDLRTVE